MRKTLPPPMKEPNVKGVAFKSVLAALDEQVGPGALAAMHERLAGTDSEVLKYRIVATGWYPISLYRSMWAAIAETTTGPAEALAKQIGRACMQRDMNGVYRLVFKLLSPETVLSLSSKMFSNYYDTGTLTVVEARAGVARASFRGCAGWSRLMWMEILGSSEMTLEMGGARDLRINYASRIGDDCESVDLLARWAT